MGKTMRWMGASITVLALVGYVVSVKKASCAETEYSGGRLVECRSTTMFQPSQHGAVKDAASAGIGSIPLQPFVMGVFGALFHGACETTSIPEGKWTVCRDGFSLLERDGAPVAWALRLKPNEDAVKKAQRKAARDEIDRPVEDSDCGLYKCSSYSSGDDDPGRDAHVYSLSDYERARLAALVRAWEREEVDRELEQARAENTALHERLKQIAVYEAQLERAEAVAQVDPGSAGQARPEH